MFGWPFVARTDILGAKHNGGPVTVKKLFQVRRQEGITAQRDADGRLVVHWNASLEPEMLYTGSSPETADLQVTTVVDLRRHKAILVGLDPSQRHFVTLVFRGGDTAVVTERILPLEGTHNFRDLGGYETVDGRRVKWGRLYRSDHLGGLTEAGQHYLEMLGVRRVYDLRTFAEADKTPDRLPPPIQYAHYPVFSHDPLDKSAILLQRDHLYDVMFDMYKTGLDVSRAICAMVFRQFAEAEKLPAVIHCSAGKDRAGLISALVLLALRVPADTVINDYSLTNLSIEHLISSAREEIARYKPFGLTLRHFYPLLAAPPQLMRAMLHYLGDKYGTVENYLCVEGLKSRHLEQLRNNLLE